LAQFLSFLLHKRITIAQPCLHILSGAAIIVDTEFRVVSADTCIEFLENVAYQLLVNPDSTLIAKYRNKPGFAFAGAWITCKKNDKIL